MKLNREGVALNAEERNKRNQNWTTLETEVTTVSDAVKEVLPIAEEALGLSGNLQAQINTLVVEGDSSVEAKQARVDAKGVEAPTLKARLDAEQQATTQQLAEKVGGEKKATMDDLGQDVKEALTGGSVAVVGVGAVGSVNVQAKAITPEKTNFLTLGKNLFNPSQAVRDTILSSAGNETVNTGYDTTGYIPIAFGKGLFLSVNNGLPQTGYRIVLYDANYVKLETISSFVNGTLITNAAAKFFKTSITKANAANLFQIEFGDKVTGYEAFSSFLESFVKRTPGTNTTVETVKTLVHQADTRRISVNRFNGKVSAIHEVNDGVVLRTTSIEYDSSGNVKSFTQSANGVNIKSTIIRLNGTVSEITKEVV